ncbi:hypothetical protein ABT144_09545 [Streptomyces sp. NPDC002039]|uniref:hypothetical protein n=1 Tax=Streptomyces sp. NPDC002039 TaxID=3154660 RepID=UPI00331CA29A
MTHLLTKVAWDHPPTAAGYGRLVTRRTKWVALLCGSMLVSVVCLWFGLIPQARLAFIVVIVVVAPYVPVVLIAYLRRHRVAAVLRSYPWREHACSYTPRATGVQATIRIPFSETYSSAYRLIPFPMDLATIENSHPDRIWFAGDPRFGGVVSPVGGHYPVRAVPAKVPADGWLGGDDVLASRVGLRRRSGKGTQT